MSPATKPWPSRTSRSPTIPPWTKPRRSRRAARCRHRAPASRSPSTRTSTTGRASSPRRMPSPSRPTASTVAVQSVGEGTGADNFILVLSSTIKQGQTVTVDYAVPTTGLRIADTAGNEAVGFTDFEVDNNSTVDGTPPVPASAEVPGSGDTYSISPSTRTSTSGRASFPRPAPSPSRPTALEVTVQSRGAGSRSGPLHPDSARPRSVRARS